MNRFLIPFFLFVSIIVLLAVQCTIAPAWTLWGVHLELLPALLLYAAFSVNLPTALILGSLAAVMYDSYSGGHLGASLIPYILSISIFCALRPIFFRNRITTQFLCGIVFGFITLLFQWALSGKVSVGVHRVLPKILHLALFSGLLAIVYFAILDLFSRLMGLIPGRFNDYDS
jgi:hypothetical protein